MNELVTNQVQGALYLRKKLAIAFNRVPVNKWQNASSSCKKLTRENRITGYDSERTQNFFYRVNILIQLHGFQQLLDFFLLSNQLSVKLLVNNLQTLQFFLLVSTSDKCM